MANLVHRVGVIFHATDRISRHMSHIGHKFEVLEKHQKEFARGEAALARQQDKLAARQTQLNAMMQRSALADTRATAARIQMKKQEEAALARLDAAEAAFQAKHEARMARGEALDRAIAERRTMLARVEAEKQLAIESQFATARERMIAASDARLATLMTKRDDVTKKQGGAVLRQREAEAQMHRIATLMAQRNTSDIMSNPMLLAQHGQIREKFGKHKGDAIRSAHEREQTLQAQRAKVEREMAHFVRQGGSKFGDEYEHQAAQAHYRETLTNIRKLEAIRETKMMGKDPIQAGIEAELYNKMIAPLRPELASQKKALDDHEKMVKMEESLRKIDNAMSNESTKLTRSLDGIRSAESAALAAATAKAITQSNKENVRDQKELAKLNREHAKALDDQVKHSYELNDVDHKMADEANKRADTLRRMRAEEQASITRMQNLERRRVEAQEAGDRRKIEAIVVEIETEEAKHRNAMENMRAELALQDRIHDEKKAALAQELASRKAIQREREREFAIARVEENMMMRRQTALDRETRSRELRQSGGRALSIAGGMTLGGLITGALVKGGVHGVAEAQQHVTSAEQRLQALGVHGKTYDAVLAMSRQQSKDVKNTSLSESIDSFIFLHGLLGSPEAIMGHNLKDKRVLEFTNKFKAAARHTFPNMKETEVEALMRAAETTSASNSPTGRKYTLDERQEHFMHRAELMFRALEITGGRLNSNAILSTVKQLQGSRFSLSDEGFLRTILYGNEVGGGKAGTAVNSLLTNLGIGSQSMRKNAELAKLGILDTKSPDVERDKKGNIIGYLPTAIKNGNLLFNDPLKWSAVTLLPAINEKLKTMGKKVTTENQSSMLSSIVMKTTGRATSQGAVVEAIRQAERFDDAIKRAQEAENVQTRFAKATEQYGAHVEQFTIETEKLNQALSKGVLPAATKFLQLVTPMVTKMGELAEKHPGAVGAATGAALGLAPALGVGALGFGAVGLSRLVGSWFAARVVAQAATTGIATTFAASFASQTVATAAAGGVSAAIGSTAVSTAAGSSLAAVFAGGAITRAVAPSMLGMMVASIGLIPTVAIGVALTAVMTAAAYYAAGKAAEVFIGGRADGQADPALAAEAARAAAKAARVRAGLEPSTAKQPWMPGYVAPTAGGNSPVVDHSGRPAGGGGGGHTTHTSKLVVEFKGTAPPGVDTKKIEKGIVAAGNTALPRLSQNTRSPNAHAW